MSIRKLSAFLVLYAATSKVANATGITYGLTKTEGIFVFYVVFFGIPSFLLFLVFLPIYTILKKKKYAHTKIVKFSFMLIQAVLFIFVTLGVLGVI